MSFHIRLTWSRPVSRIVAFIAFIILILLLVLLRQCTSTSDKSTAILQGKPISEGVIIRAPTQQTNIPSDKMPSLSTKSSQTENLPPKTNVDSSENIQEPSKDKPKTPQEAVAYAAKLAIDKNAQARPYVIMQGATFEADSLKMLAGSTVRLQRIIARLKLKPELTAEVAGYTDNLGDEKTNQHISQLRADAVCDYLIDNGIDASRLTAVGYGEASPVASNATEEGRKKNRRVEIHIFLTP